MNSDINKFNFFTTNRYEPTRTCFSKFFLRSYCSSCLWLILFLILFFSSCSSQKPEHREIPIQRDGKTIAVVKAEIADTNEERTKGLMYREKLPDGEGMLFIFDKDDILSFWMKNTYIPLSIAFITNDGKIIDIRNMYPNDETSVMSSRSARYALEVPQGWFTRIGVKEGDIVLMTNVE